MDIAEKVANISLQDEHRNSPRVDSDSSQTDTTRNSSVGSDSDEIREKFMQLVTKARQRTEDGDIAAAIKLNEEALAIHFSDKLQRRIAKMKAFLADQEKSDGEDEGDDGDMKSLGNGFMLHRKLHEKLYRHQKEGVLWMWSLFQLGKGGILADDMGLGKTIQMIAFLAGLFDMNKIKSVMIVVPLSVLPNWLSEFNKWTPGINVMQFHGSSKKEKERALARVRTRGGVLMTTYGLVVTTKDTFAERHGQEFVWDYVILDEGHKIKNATKTSKSIHLVPAKHRLILTGTPVQNNLKELWSLFDYVHQGSLLGTVRTFKMEFETPIIRARERDATAVEKKLGQEMAQTLKSIIQPYFLRRTKAEVSAGNSDRNDDSRDLKMPTMTRKNDLVIWLHLTETQQQIYQDFINLDQVKELLMTKKSPLVALTVLKKICDHPRLLSTRACLQLGLDGDNFNEEDLEQPEAYESAVTQIKKIPDDVLLQESGKLQILVSLVDSFKAEGHRTLIFSQSRKLLDIIQKVITNRGHKVARLDGTVTHLTERDKIVKRFQSDSSISVLLLTVQVGGVGLTITSADRVIIYDPSWNPATDAQAVDRAYRIGQVKNVVVYRLITCGTVEEKIYRRQVFKDSITRQTTGSNKNPYRYFTKMELKELFTLDDPKFSKTQKQLESLHGNQRQTDTNLDEHIAFLHSLDIFGISDHDLMFQQKSVRDDEDDDVEVMVGQEEEQNNARFIEHRIKKAQMLIAEESAGLIPYEERSKGVMKYPPTTTSSSAVSGGFKPKPSQLFTQIAEDDSAEAVNEKVSDTEISHRESDRSSHDVTDKSSPSHELIDLMAAGDNSISGADVVSPCKKKTKSSVRNSPRKSLEKRVLQALTPEEVQRRSPCTPVNKPSAIMTEELLISPDTRSPIMRLEKVFKRDQSISSSLVDADLTSPKSHVISGGLSPSRLLRLSQGSGLKNISSSRKPDTSPPGKTQPSLNLRKVFAMEATSTPHTFGEKSPQIFVEETPDSSTKSSRMISTSNSSTSSSEHRKSLDVSHASRKLSFVVADSDQSFNNSMDSSPLPVARSMLKIKSQIDDQSPQDSATFPSADVSLTSFPQVDARMPVTLDECGHMSRLLHEQPSSLAGSDILMSPKITSDVHVDPGKNKGHKRRSVCIQKAFINNSDDDYDDDDITKRDSQKSTQAEIGSEDERRKDESDVDEDKENVPVWVKNVGGRQRIVSDSESGESCFEVVDSEEEEEEDKRSLGSQGREGSPASDKTETQAEDNSHEETKACEVGMEEEEEEEEAVDEEQNERFQNLISVARAMYKQKSFTESLLYVEEALTIFHDPDLEKMADKIRVKIREQQV